MKRTWTLIGCAAALSLATLSVAEEPQQPEQSGDFIQLSFDPYLSIQSGADLSFSLVSAVARGENWVFGHLDKTPAAQRPLRSVWTLVFDMPIAWWFGVYLHEAYGHGGRAREAGSSASFHMGSPWERRSSYAGFDTDGLTNDDLLTIYSGGSEANSYAATQLEREMAGGRAMRPLEALYVTANRLVTSTYVLSTTPHPDDDPLGFWREWSGGGDVAHYLGYHHTRFAGEAGITQQGAPSEIVEHYEQLRRHAYWNALDPGAWLSLYTAWRTVIRGESMSRIPMLRLGGRRFLPVFSSEWLLRGSTASLELVFGERIRGPVGDGTRWFSFVVRQGSGYDGRVGALGAATESFARTRTLRFGGQAEMWDRPGGRVGGGFQLRVSVRRGPVRGLFVEAGAKTEGHWPGRPLQAGPMIRIGYRLQTGATPRSTTDARRSSGREPVRLSGRLPDSRSGRAD